MPQNLYYHQFCNTNASTQFIWPQWTTSQSYTYVPQSYQPTFYTQTTSTGTTDLIWQHWINSTSTYGSGIAQWTPIHETDEQRTTRRRERVAACAKARVLLEEFLSDEQKVELERHGSFHVTGSKGRRYCIRTSGQAGNVDLLRDDGGVQATLCCHPRDCLPDGDAWLMQMIEIRHDEDHFLRTANVHLGSLPIAA